MRTHKNAQFNLRLPSELREWIAEEAKRRYMPMNSLFIELILQAKEKQEKK